MAALTVVFAHLHVVLPDSVQATIGLDGSPLGFLATGRAAVILFFVLSGFVLSLSLMSPRAPGFSAFVTRRLCRIYLPFAAAILLAVGLKALVQPEPIPELSNWLDRRAWNLETTPSLILSHLAMIGRWQDRTLNPPMWSLVIELRISLIFPLLFYLVTRRPRWPVYATIGTLALTQLLGASRWLPIEPYSNNSVISVPLLTLYFVSFFVLGIMLAQHRHALFAWVRGIGGPRRTLLLLVAIGLMCVQLDLAYGVAAAILLLLAAGSPSAEHWLKRPAMQWLGRVSYSLYLTHLPVLLTLVHLGYGKVPLPLILAAALVLSLVVAEIAYRTIEAPSIRLGQRLTRREPRPGVAAEAAEATPPAKLAVPSLRPTPAAQRPRAQKALR